MSCCLTAPAPTLSLNITHPTILNIECEAERGNIADIGTGHCWQLAWCWGQSLLDLENSSIDTKNASILPRNLIIWWIIFSIFFISIQSF